MRSARSAALNPKVRLSKHKRIRPPSNELTGRRLSIPSAAEETEKKSKSSSIGEGMKERGSEIAENKKFASGPAAQSMLSSKNEQRRPEVVSLAPIGSSVSDSSLIPRAFAAAICPSS